MRPKTGPKPKETTMEIRIETFKVNAGLVKGGVDADGCAEMDFVRPCPQCGGHARQRAIVALEPKRLPSGHTPERGEIIRNISRECFECGDLEVS